MVPPRLMVRLVVEGLVRQHRVRVLEHGEPLLGPLVRDDGGAGVLERLAAGDVVVVMVAVDQVLDRLFRDLLDLVDVGLPARRPAVGDRVGSDHAGLGDDEHRLMVAVAEDVDVVGAFHLGRLERRAGGCGRRRGWVWAAGGACAKLWPTVRRVRAAVAANTARLSIWTFPLLLVAPTLHVKGALLEDDAGRRGIPARADVISRRPCAVGARSPPRHWASGKRRRRRPRARPSCRRSCPCRP